MANNRSFVENVQAVQLLRSVQNVYSVQREIEAFASRVAVKYDEWRLSERSNHVDSSRVRRYSSEKSF
jgi:hypothetical protein